MSTVPKPTQTVKPIPPTPKPAAFARVSNGNASEPAFLFDKENYMWMIGGVVMILIGFMLMSGGKSPDPHKFNYEEIYSFRRITLAPLVILAGFVVEVFAIMKKPKESAPAEPVSA